MSETVALAIIAAASPIVVMIVKDRLDWKRAERAKREADAKALEDDKRWKHEAEERAKTTRAEVKAEVAPVAGLVEEIHNEVVPVDKRS